MSSLPDAGISLALYALLTGTHALFRVCCAAPLPCIVRQRLLGVLEDRLAGRQFIMGDEYTIADIATFPWVAALSHFYEVRASRHTTAP